MSYQDGNTNHMPTVTEHGYYIQNGITKGYRKKITEKQFKDKKYQGEGGKDGADEKSDE